VLATFSVAGPVLATTAVVGRPACMTFAGATGDAFLFESVERGENLVDLLAAQLQPRPDDLLDALLATQKIDAEPLARFLLGRSERSR